MSTFSEYVNRSARAAGYDLSGPRSGGRKALAEAAGMGQTAVGRMLAGQCLPNPYVLPNLATALSVPVEDLLRLVGLLPEARKDTGESTQPALDFFQAGHGYTHLDGHDFLCVTVTTHPRTGRLYAMGWISEGGQLHRPAVEDINAWRHEYDGCKPPDEGPDGAYVSTRGEPGGDA
jgi:hypothetical protein